MIDLSKGIMRLMLIVLVVLLTISLNACATSLPPKLDHSDSMAVSQPTVNAETENVKVTTDDNIQQLAWWYVAFRRDWEEPVPWHYDVYIAYRVIKPVLDDFNSQLKLWRFHRRAAPDPGGHRFTFYFYSSRETAAKIYEKINSDSKIVAQLENTMSFKVSKQDINNNNVTDINATSDKSWSPEIQVAWPDFAMGISKTWLSLIESVIVNNGLDGLNTDAELETQLVLCKAINERIDSLWENQGGHAFFHHLNALFAYKELYIFERNLRRF